MHRSLLLLTSILLCTAAGADLIVPQTSAPHILIPAAGSAAGANGTFFRSDIQVVNLRSVSQRVVMYWLPQGRNGAAIAPHTIELGASSGLSSEDFVASVMLQEGVGAIEFVGITNDGNFDSDAQLQVTSRIWTPRPDGGTGTMSQTFPSLIMPGSTARAKTIFGLRRSSQYRLNIGIANPGQTVHHFRVTAISAGQTSESVQFELDVQPRSTEQRSAALTKEGVVQVLIENLTTGTATDWQGWASSIDNDSGDAWSQIAFPTP